METKILDTESAVRNINGFMKKSTLNVIFVGRELGKLKDKIEALSGSEQKSAELEYELMFEGQLPFGKKVAEKFVRISRNKFICRYAHQMPSSYTSLYELCSKNISDDMWKIILEKINPAMTTSEVTALRTTAAHKVNNAVEVVKVEDALGIPTKKDLDLSGFAEDEKEPSTDVEGTTQPVAETSEEDAPTQEPVAETSEVKVVLDSEQSSENEEDKDAMSYFLSLASNSDAFDYTEWDEALTFDNLVQINTSPNATDEEIGYLMGLINEFEDKIKSFIAAKEGVGEAA